MHRIPFVGSFALIFPPGGSGAWSWGDDRLAQALCLLLVVIVEQDGGRPLPQVPFNIIRRHAQEHVPPNAIIQPVVNRPDVQVDRLQTTKRTKPHSEPRTSVRAEFARS